MDICCIKCLVFTKNNIKVNSEIDERNNLYSRCIGCASKKFATIDAEETSDLSTMLSYCLKCRKNT